MNKIRDCNLSNCEIRTHPTESGKKNYLHASCSACGLSDTACVETEPKVVEVLKKKALDIVGVLRKKNDAIRAAEKEKKKADQARTKNALRDIHTTKDEPE